jgi:competence protein ComGC
MGNAIYQNLIINSRIFMNRNLKIRLFHHCLNKNYHQGATIVEALILLLTLGGLILAAQFLISDEISGCYNCAEGKKTTILMNSSQEKYFLKHDKFAPNLQELDAIIKDNTSVYTYHVKATETGVYNYAVARREYIKRAKFFRIPMHSYVGAVFVAPKDNKSDLITIKIICENNQPGSIRPAEPIYKNGVIQCAPGTKEI